MRKDCPNLNPNVLLTQKEAWKELEISESAFKNYRRKGWINPFKGNLGSRPYYTGEAVNKLYYAIASQGISLLADQ